MSRAALLISTFGYVGFFPIAPGTAGSAAALALYAIVRWVGHPVVEVGTMLVVLFVGVWSATETERVLARTDPGPVVIDEVLGMLMTLALLPLSAIGVAIGFVLFRIFDVIKPFPARRLESAPGGWGIMLDDAMAGVYGFAAMRLIAWLAPEWVLA